MTVDDKSGSLYDPLCTGDVVLANLPPLPDLLATDPSPTIKANDVSDRDDLSLMACPCKRCLCIECKCGTHKEDDSILSAPTGSETGEPHEHPETDTISVLDILPIEPSILEAKLLGSTVK